MTDEQILQLVKKYFNEGGIRDDGSSLMSVDFQQNRFSLAFAFFTEYFSGWSF